LPLCDGRDLARVLLQRAADDAALVRHVVENLDIADAIASVLWRPCAEA
jgi:hypothetical protein